MRVEFSEGANAELEEATAWYLAHGSEHSVDYGVDLAGRFLDELERVSTLIGERPNLSAEVEPGVRRALLRGFPYSLVYAIEPDYVLVLAVMHHKRRPDYWRDRNR